MGHINIYVVFEIRGSKREMIKAFRTKNEAIKYIEYQQKWYDSVYEYEKTWLIDKWEE